MRVLQSHPQLLSGAPLPKSDPLTVVGDTTVQPPLLHYGVQVSNSFICLNSDFSMSTDSADIIPPGNDEREKGDTSNNTNIVDMMQKNIASLTSTVFEMQQKQGKKQKADEGKPGPSRPDLSDVSENEFGGKD